MTKTLMKLTVFTSSLILIYLSTKLWKGPDTRWLRREVDSWRRIAVSIASDEYFRSLSVNRCANMVDMPAGSLNETERTTGIRQKVHVVPPFRGLPNSSFRSPYHRHWDTNCSLIFKRDISVINATTKLVEDARHDREHPLIPSDEQFAHYTNDCSSFRRNRKYPTKPLSTEEEEFPLAYIILTHVGVAQVERLLRAIYQPQNIYCIHPDRKSPPTFQEGIRGLVSCFENVFISSNVERVVYKGYSRLQADINCMEDLLRTSVRWKYLMNLCAQDFPLKTNLETVRQMKAVLGQNIVETHEPGHKRRRWKYRNIETSREVRKTEEENPPPPHNFTMFVGNAYNAFTRAFVDYVIHDTRAIALLKWSVDTKTPDEHYWATLQKYPGVPGGNPYAHAWGKAFRFVLWWTGKPPCIGQNVRGVCVFGSGYLTHLLSQPHIFANKFHYDFDPVAIQCMEEMLDYRQRYPESITQLVPEFPITDLVQRA